MVVYRIALLFLLTASTLFAEAPLGIRGGTEAFRQGDFNRAAEAFAEAEKKNVDDLRIAFNHGAALAAAGKLDEAVETLRKSATAKDPVVASKSLSMLGRIAVDRARQSLAAAPEETSPEQRQAVLEYLAAAERHYSEAMAVRPDDDGRRNLEEIRAWRSRITEDWENADRAQKRSEDITERLRWLEEWEETLHKSVRETVETPDSPQKFQRFFDAAKEQGRVAREIGMARDELLQTLAEAPQDESIVEAEAHPLIRELDSLKGRAETAEKTLRNFRGEESAELLRDSARRLGRLRMNLAPYEMIVEEAEKRQAKLCETSPARSPSAGESESREEQSASQQTVSSWMPLLTYRAKQGLEQLDGLASEQSSNRQAPPPEQTEAMKKSMELAVRHGPELQELTADAAGLLHENQPAEALPKQDRALQLLREILEPLRQQQQQDQQQSDQQNQDQQNQQTSEDPQDKSQEQDQKDGRQQKPEPQEKPENEPQESDRSEQEKQDEKKQEADSKEQKEQQQEKAERMLRQVKRKQQEANEKREKIRALLLQAEPVEKDW